MTDQRDPPGNARSPGPTPSRTPARAAADERAANGRHAPHALARWSERRRRVAEAEGPSAFSPDDDAPPPDAVAANRAAAEAVDVEALGPGADVSALLREGVPDALRRTALRALWRSDPVFANVDRLCDYDDDFRNPRMVLETLQSAWQAGRGYLFADEEADGSDDEAPVTEAADDVQNEVEPIPTAVSATAPGTDGDAAPRNATVEPPAPLDAPPSEPSADRIADGPALNGRLPDESPSPERVPDAPLAEAPSLRARLGL